MQTENLYQNHVVVFFCKFQSYFINYVDENYEFSSQLTEQPITRFIIKTKRYSEDIYLYRSYGRSFLSRNIWLGKRIRSVSNLWGLEHGSLRRNGSFNSPLSNWFILANVSGCNSTPLIGSTDLVRYVNNWEFWGCMSSMEFKTNSERKSRIFFLPEIMRLFEESAERSSPLYVLPIYKRNPISKNLWMAWREYFCNRVNAKFASDQTRGYLREILFRAFEMTKSLFSCTLSFPEAEERRVLYHWLGAFVWLLVKGVLFEEIESVKNI
jgi:hypothetical protein